MRRRGAVSAVGEPSWRTAIVLGRRSRFPHETWRFSLWRPPRLTVTWRICFSLCVKDTPQHCRGAPPGSGLVHIYYIFITLVATLRSAAVPILNDIRDNPLFIVHWRPSLEAEKCKVLKPFLTVCLNFWFYFALKILLKKLNSLA